MENNEKKISFREAVRRNQRGLQLFWEAQPALIISCLCYRIVSAASPYVTIWLSARIISELAGRRDPSELLRLVLIQLLSAAGLALVKSIANRWHLRECYSGYYGKEHIWAEKMLHMDYADVDKQSTYDLYSQIRQNENWSGWGLWKVISNFEEIIDAATSVACGIGLSVSLFTSRVPAAGGKLTLLNHPLCAAVMILLLLGIALLSPLCANRGNEYWVRHSAEATFGNRYFSFFGTMGEDRERAADIRMYDQEKKVCQVYMKRANSFGVHSAIAKYARGPMGLYMGLSQSLGMLLTGIVYLFVCLKAWGGAFGVGAVTQYVGAITNLFLGISALLLALGNMKANALFLEHCFAFLDIPNQMYQGSLTTEKRSDRQYEVEFRDVSFRYPGADPDSWALRHVNMKFRVGSRMAVVGMNGSGKTTFIKLLCRLYDPTEGQILLNGIDIRKYQYDDYIRVFSVVFQDFKLAGMPLGQNVAGAARYDRERVLDCLEKAGFTDRLARMPRGLDTYLYKELEQEGVEISGGEAQKIAIARALYKDAPFIILDEPTAALDPVAEAEIYSKFNEIAGDKTAIYISHRLSSCRFCDEIAVFHEGAVIQQGSHEELVSDETGKYYELWHAQAQYYVEA